MKIGIIGSGLVGSTAAYALVMRGIGREVVLVDLNKERASAEADDIFHAVPFAHPVSVRDGDYADLEGCKVVVITAGVGQRPDESRRDLLGRNAAVSNSIVPQILQAAPEAVLLVASNPVDVMTHLTARIAAESGLPGSRVMGTGTTLDTARFRVLLGRCLGVDAQHVHAYVIGEHGDSEVLTWSLAAVGGIPLEEYSRMQNQSLCAEDRATIDEQVRRAAFHIIAGKGATYYGVGSAIARIVEVILKDQRSILTVCTPIAEIAGVKNVTLSLPHLVGGEGALSTLYPPVDVQEEQLLHASAEIIAADIALLS
ncbi:MAG TPA: L-lactate dehydrogenase [Anaerolineales bacterium]|nr:L-lactate dehydrogenase [Anaerolineales bacterium]